MWVRGVKFCGLEFRFSRNYFWVREILLLNTAENLPGAVKSKWRQQWEARHNHLACQRPWMVFPHGSSSQSHSSSPWIVRTDWRMCFNCTAWKSNPLSGRWLLALKSNLQVGKFMTQVGPHYSVLNTQNLYIKYFGAQADCMALV